MNTRRGFFQQLASGLIVAAAPRLFLPKLIKPVWKTSYEQQIIRLEYPWYEVRREVIISWAELKADGLIMYDN